MYCSSEKQITDLARRSIGSICFEGKENCGGKAVKFLPFLRRYGGGMKVKKKGYGEARVGLSRKR